MGRRGVVLSFLVVVVSFLLWVLLEDSNYHPLIFSPNLINREPEEFIFSKVNIFFKGKISKGPESIRENPIDGWIYTATTDGNIYRFKTEEDLELVTNVGPKPNGFDFDSEGRMVIADAQHGRLIRLDLKTQQIEVLTTEVKGKPFGLFTNDVKVAKNGMIYFTVSDELPYFDPFGHPQHQEAIVRAAPNGKLLRFDPTTNQTELLADGFIFLNGIVLSHDESFILVCETARYRILRFWLQGTKAGSLDVFADSLPGFVDNPTLAENGNFWVSIYAPRGKLLELIHPYPKIKKLLFITVKSLALIKYIEPPPEGNIVLLNSSGEILTWLQDKRSVAILHPTSANQIKDKLYIGNTDYPWLAVYSLK